MAACRCFLLLSLFLFSSVADALAEKATDDQAIERLTRYLNAMQSMEASFHQWVEDAKSAKLQDVKGKMLVKRPGKFRWESYQPYPQLLVTDGKILWVVDEDLEQATKKRLDKQVGNTPALLFSGDPAAIAKSFQVSAQQYPQNKEWRFDLKPKDEEALFELLRVHFVKGKLVDMFLRDSLGQTTRIEFSQRKFNIDIDDSRFSYVPGANIDVISDL